MNSVIFEASAIIFDLDGVICNTDKYHYQAWKQASLEAGILFDEEVGNLLRGISRIESAKIILRANNNPFTPKDTELLAKTKNDIYLSLISAMKPSDIDETIREELQKLHNQGYRLAIASSSKNAKYIIEKTEMADYFYVIVDGQDINIPKPDPTIFLLTADKLRCMPNQCIVVEDARAGIEAAKKAGMIAFSYYGSAKECGLEDYNLKAFDEIERIVKLI